MMYLDLFKALVYTAVFSLLLTPLDFKLARAVGAIDVPNDSRKIHKKPIPRIGGFSIFLSAVLGVISMCGGIYEAALSFTIGTIIIVALGILDDCFALSAKTKLTVQTAAAIISVSLLFVRESKEAIFYLFGIIWIITLTNAHNFIDGLDGLCCGVSLIEATSLGVIFLFCGEFGYALSAFVISGACIGFLPYNSKNAKIFMGDTGSTFLGFSLGFMSLHVISEQPNVSTLFSMFLVLFVPLSDMIFAVTRRTLRGKSPFESDRSHIHHILSDSTLGHNRASLLLRLYSLLSALVGVWLFL